MKTKSRSYQAYFFLVFWFSLLSLLAEKQKNVCFPKKKSLVGLSQYRWESCFRLNFRSNIFLFFSFFPEVLKYKWRKELNFQDPVTVFPRYSLGLRSWKISNREYQNCHGEANFGSFSRYPKCFGPQIPKPRITKYLMVALSYHFLSKQRNHSRNGRKMVYEVSHNFLLLVYNDTSYYTSMY